MRHPAVVLGFLLSIPLALVGRLDLVPVLDRDVTWLPVALLPLAGGMLLATFAAGTRPRRHDAQDLHDAAATNDATRVAGQLFSLLWAAGMAATFVVSWVVFAKAIGGVGWPSALAVLDAVLVVVVAGAAGIVLAAWTPRPAVAPLALVLIGAIEAYAYTADGSIRALAPALTSKPFIAPALDFRPTGAHAVYLTGLGALLGVGALLRHDRRTVPGVALALALTVIATSALAATRPPSDDEIDQRVALVEQPDPHRTCQRHGDVEYCAWHGYQELIERWRPPVEGVLAATPAEATPSQLLVEQHLEARSLIQSVHDWAGRPARDTVARRLGLTFGAEPWWLTRQTNELTVDTSWHRGARSELGLALAAAASVTGIPAADVETYTWTTDDVTWLGSHYVGFGTLPQAGQQTIVADRCWLHGQAREVIAIWLAATATPGTAQGLRDLTMGNPWGIKSVDQRGRAGFTMHGPVLDELANPSEGTRISWSREAAYLARQLLNRPDPQTRSQIHQQWDRWTHPDATLEELVTAFDLTPIPTVQESLQAAGLPSDHAPPEPTTITPLDTDEPPPLRSELSACR